MKLYNKTKCPDEILTPLLTKAGSRAGVRTGAVVVKVTQGQNPVCRGRVSNADWVYQWHLIPGLRRKTEWVAGAKHVLETRGRLKGITTDGGWIQISIPAPHGAYDSIALAEQFFWTAVHEWAHIRDFQSRDFLPWSRAHNGRRPKWGNRPEEIRAQNAVNDAKEKPLAAAAQDAILALALWLEGNKTQ